jgi:hypothetical protein
VLSGKQKLPSPEFYPWQKWCLSFAKTLADCEINDIAAAISPAFCYDSWPYFD